MVLINESSVPAKVLTASKHQAPLRSSTHSEEGCSEDRAMPLLGVASIDVVLSEA